MDSKSEKASSAKTEKKGKKEGKEGKRSSRKSKIPKGFLNENGELISAKVFISSIWTDTMYPVHQELFLV